MEKDAIIKTGNQIGKNLTKYDVEKLINKYNTYTDDKDKINSIKDDIISLSNQFDIELPLDIFNDKRQTFLLLMAINTGQINSKK